jgi:hypothetical protein
VSHTAVSVNDNNACTIDACDPMTGVSHLPVTIDDGNACTVDACDPMTGVSHAPINPNDNNICTLDSCSPMTGVSNAPQVAIYAEDFSDNSAGWTLGPEWQIGGAQASTGGQYGADPAMDHTPTADNGVAGVVLGGNASDATLHGYYYLESPPINATVTQGQVVLSFWRWLNSDYDPYMHNRIEVWSGAQWQVLWQTTDEPGVQDSPPYGNGWTNVRYNLTQYAGPGLRVRFGFDVTSLAVYDIGSWNIDDVEILNTAVPTDDNICTADGCSPALGATFSLASTDDGSLCTTDACDPLRQVSHAPIDCSGLDSACAAGACDPATGQCAASSTNEGMTCDDGSECTLNATCSNGTCFDPTGPGYFFYEDFADNTAGWTLQGMWQIAPAVASLGCVGCGDDPGIDHTATADNGVAGVAIGGCSQGGAGMCLTSPVINITQIPGPVWLDFWRHGHLDYVGFQTNRIQVWDGAAWAQLYVNDTNDCENDALWTNHAYDVTAYKNPAFQVRFCTENTSGAYDTGNWTIDDLTIAPIACTP